MMEENIKQVYCEIKELSKAVNNISQFAAAISERLSAHDKKLDIIISALNGFPVLSQKEKYISNKTDSSKTTDHKLSHDFGTSKREIQDKETDQKSINVNSQKTNTVSKSDDSFAKSQDENQASTSAKDLLPYNMSTPSITLLNIEPTKVCYSSTAWLRHYDDRHEINRWGLGI